MSGTYDIAERLRLWSPLIASGYEVPAAAAVMHAAAAEIERLHAEVVVMQARVAAMQRCIDERTDERDAARLCLSVVEEIAERSGEINKSLTAERDEARREYCLSQAIVLLHEANPNALISYHECRRIEREIAAERGWDCFEKEAKP